MLSRRNLRIKVMQALYIVEHDSTYEKARLNQFLKSSIRAYYHAYLHSLYYLIHTAEFSITDAQIQAGKHINKNENISVRIFHNPIIQNLVLDKSLQADFNKLQFDLKADQDHFRRFYGELKKSEEYQTFLNSDESDLKETKKILIYLFKEIIFKQEVFVGHMEEFFNNWEDDCDLVNMTMHQTIDKFKPTVKSAVVKISEDFKEEDEFCLDLLEQTLVHHEELNDFITPRLKNWELDRVATVDIIVMRMALTEWLFFPSIPVKVTINEYIDIAKRYSTPKSGDFVNGILDNILKDLREKNLVQKKGRGLIEF